jgi:uncharacterized protein YraI
MFRKTFFGIAILVLALASCSLPRTGGIVQGVVYADLDGSGTIEEPAEGPLEGVQVTLEDCGPTQTQVTGADGAFHFADLPEGTCHVSVMKGGWEFSGSFPLISYPMPVASDPDLPTAFSMFMAPVMDFIPTDTPVPGVPTDTPVPGVPTDTPTLPPDAGPAMVTPSGSEAVNCRFGPGTAYLAVGGLAVGSTVPITGKSGDGMWWQIQNPMAIGTFCWVSAAVTHTSGNISAVPVVAAPAAFVVSVSVSAPAVIHGFCHGPNATAFQVSIATNGPATVMYHVEIYNGDGTWRNSTTDAALTFASAGTQTVDPGGAYKTDCGEFYIVAVITSPNALTSAQTHWKVVEP